MFNWKARHRSLIRVLLIPRPQPGPACEHKKSWVTLVFGAAQRVSLKLQTINIPLSIGVWGEGREITGISLWMTLISENMRGNMRGWLEDNGFHWTDWIVKCSLEKQTSYISFCQDARKMARLSMITNSSATSNYNHSTLQCILYQDDNVFVIIILPNIHSPRNFMLTCSK